MARKQINFPVSDKEHENIKVLASKKRKSVKQLILDTFDELYPDWNEEENKNSPKQDGNPT